ncbi:MAG: phosphoribosylanthranilate isomerase [Bacteroidales bacterium]|nr:phosphoribosylanthranilate isomerase [Bacteroidales bacterium]
MINNKLVKVCGMTEGENIRDVEALGVDLIGFIFWPGSPRFVREVPTYLPRKAGRVGVFVDATREEILRRNETFGFTYVQLHGNESPEFCARLREQDGLRVIKAFGIADEDVRNTVVGYEGACDLFLFDTKTPGHGGSGRRFDWSVMDDYEEKTRFILSGGIGMDMVATLHDFIYPFLAGFDLNSRFETAPGIKDPELLEIFMENLQR